MSNTSATPVSVILPVYNGGHYLTYAIDSVLAQTFADFEFLIINDGSTDTSEAIIRAYTDPRIRYFSQSNIGLTRTLNRLIAEARHPLLARMDQDDWSDPQRLQTQVAFLTAHPGFKMCGSWIQAMDTHNQPVYRHQYPVTTHAIRDELLLSNPFAHGSVMIRNGSDVFYRTDADDAEDIDHWARHCMHHPVANIPHILYHWRVNPEGISHSRAAKQQAAAKRVRSQFLGWYLQQATAQMPPREELATERRLTGWRTLFRRKRALMHIFREANRPDLVQREWRYLWQAMF